jgi:hypothetical protein
LNPHSPWSEENSDFFNRPLAESLTKSLQKIHTTRYVHLKKPFGHLNNVPLTPQQSFENKSHPTIYQFACDVRAISAILGSSYTHSQMKQAGTFVQQIFPLKEYEQSNTASSSKKSLALHTEHAAFNSRPDFLVIGCLRNDEKIPTFVSVPDLRVLSKKTLEILRKTRVNEDFEESCILSEKNFDLSFRYDSVFIKLKSKKAETAFQELTRLLNASTVNVIMESGDILVIDNLKAAHGRESFDAKYNGRDRWILRSMVGSQKMLNTK